MADRNVDMNDLLGGEEVSDESAVPSLGDSYRIPNAQPRHSGPSGGQADILRRRYEEVNTRLMHALGNDYDGYKLDTDAQGNAHFGKKGYAKYEQDKLMRDELRDRINESREHEREERTSAQASLERAKQLIKKVFEEEIRYVNKEHHADVQSLFLHSLRGVNWGDVNLRSDAAKEGLLSMIFGWAAQKIRRERQAPSSRTSGQQIDASHDDVDAREPGGKSNEFGFEEGSIGFDITQQFSDRLRRRHAGPLGGRKPNQ